MKRLALIAAAALCGCGAFREPWSGDPRLPGGDVLYGLDPRGDPWARLDRAEQRYRDVAGNFVGHTGLDALRYPVTTKVGAAWQYVEAGRDFAARGEHGAAARAHWAALTLARRTFASRPDRERVRRAAYEGLAASARAREQPRWAALLGLCADLARVYLGSPEAGAHREAFEEELARLQEAEDRARAAQRAASAALFSAQMKSAIDSANAQIATASIADPAERLRAQGMIGLSAAQASVKLGLETAEASSAFGAALASIGRGAGEFKAVAAEDVAEVQAGQSFAAVEVAFYLAGAKPVAPYLERLRSYAKEEPGVRAAIDAYGDLKKQDDPAAALAALVSAVKDVELEIAKCERRGKPCAPREAPEAPR